MPATTITEHPQRSRHVSGVVYVVIAVFCGLGLLGKLDLLGVAFHMHSIFSRGMVVAAVFAPALWWLGVRFRAICAPLFLIGMAGIVLFIYPHVRQLHKIGRGSDQADCVIVAGDQMLKGRWPYERALLWSHNPMSCGPGWTALQAPTIRVLGYQSTILLIWTCALVALVRHIGWQRTSAIISMVFLSAGVWLALANGSDFLSFGICILALAMVYDSTDEPSIALSILTALVVQFRAPVVFLPMFMKKGKGRRTRIFASIIASATFGVFLLLKPRQMIVDGPLFLFQKLIPDGQAAPPLAGGWLTFVFLFVCGLIFCLWLSDRFAGLWPTMIYMLILFGIPALLSLAKGISRSHSVLDGLKDWEGGMWLLACLPLAAGLFVRESGMLNAFPIRTVQKSQEYNPLPSSE